MVLGNNVHVYLSLQALQLKLVSVKMRLTSVTNVFFGAQLLLGAGKKSCTASLKRLVGIRLGGLEIEWTTSALSRYLQLNRAPAGSSPQQNAALGCVKGAQTSAHPLSGFDLSTQDGASQPARVPDGSGCVRTWVREGSREGESGSWAAVFCSLRSLFALQSWSRRQHRMRLHVGSCDWMTDYCLTRYIKRVLKGDLGAKGAQQPGLWAEAPLSDGWLSGLSCCPGRTSPVNDPNSSN